MQYIPKSEWKRSAQVYFSFWLWLKDFLNLAIEQTGSPLCTHAHAQAHTHARTRAQCPLSHQKDYHAVTGETETSSLAEPFIQGLRTRLVLLPLSRSAFLRPWSGSSVCLQGPFREFQARISEALMLSDVHCVDICADGIKTTVSKPAGSSARRRAGAQNCSSPSRPLALACFAWEYLRGSS